MQRIDELKSPPIVGQYYLVPTVMYFWNGKTRAWPVTGPKHTDVEHLNFRHPHYHVDGRFITELQGEGGAQTADENVGRNPLCRFNAATREKIDAKRGIEPHPPVVWRRRKCRREIAYAYGANPTIQKLRQAFADKPLARTDCGRVCPHKGAPVDSLKPDAHGIITCPLHGLRFDFETGAPRP